LYDASRTDNNARDSSLVKQPGECDACRRSLMCCGYLSQHLDNCVALRLSNWGKRRVGAPAWLVIAGIFPTEKAASKRAPNQNSHLQLAYRWKNLVFQLSGDQRIIRLG
jgi:hypothetical protein